MPTYLPLGTGFYTANSPRNPKDVNITALASQTAVDITANYANDAAAAAGGIAVGQVYNSAGAVKVRLT